MSICWLFKLYHQLEIWWTPKKGSHLLTPLKIIIFLTPFATFVDQLACNAVAKSLISLFFLSRMFVAFVRFV